MKKYLVIGNPIDHSLSPQIHNYWIKKNNINAIYKKKRVNTNELKDIIFEIKKKKIINYSDVNNIQFDIDEKYDLIFLDGNHNYLQLRKDAIKAFKLLKKGGWILLHYFMPRTWLEEHVPVLYKGHWVGDCWKFGYELSLMKSINFITVQIDFGICLIPFSENIIEVPDFSRTFDFANKTSNYDFFIKNKNKLNIKTWDDSIKWIDQSNCNVNNQIKNYNL